MNLREAIDALESSVKSALEVAVKEVVESALTDDKCGLKKLNEV